MTQPSIASRIADKAYDAECRTARALGYDCLHVFVSAWKVWGEVYLAAYEADRPATLPRFRMIRT